MPKLPGIHGGEITLSRVLELRTKSGGTVVDILPINDKLKDHVLKKETYVYRGVVISFSATEDLVRISFGGNNMITVPYNDLFLMVT